MKVFVAGGSGVIGRRLIPRLVDAGHDVVATTSSRDGLGDVAALGAEPVVMDGLDEVAVIRAVADAEPEVVINEMTSLAGATNVRRFDHVFAVTNELRTRGNDYLLHAARVADVRRMIAQGFTGWSNDRGGAPVQTEEDRLDPSPPRPMRRSLQAISYLERRVAKEADLEGVVLRYGSLYGPATAFETEYAEAVRKRMLPLIGDGAGIWSFLHIDDAATATALAVEHGDPGVYNVVDDDPAPISEWLPYLAEVLGAGPPRRVPAWLARIAAGDVLVSMSTRIRGSSNHKAKDSLGWSPAYPSWRAGFRGNGPKPNGSNGRVSRAQVEAIIGG